MINKNIIKKTKLPGQDKLIEYSLIKIIKSFTKINKLIFPSDIELNGNKNEGNAVIDLLQTLGIRISKTKSCIGVNTKRYFRNTDFFIFSLALIIIEKINPAFINDQNGRFTKKITPNL